MQQLCTQLPVKFGRPFGLTVLLVVFFIVAQVMMSFHSHNPLSSLEDDEPVHHQIECDVCLVVHMASHSGDGVSLRPPSFMGGGAVVALPHDSWTTWSVSPSHARAPPQV